MTDWLASPLDSGGQELMQNLQETSPPPFLSLPTQRPAFSHNKSLTSAYVSGQRKPRLKWADPQLSLLPLLIR